MKFRKVTSALLATAMVCGLLTNGMGQVKAANLNIAQGKSVTASSYEVESTSPAKVVDGDVSTRWGTGQNAAAGEYVEIDLGSKQDVKKIVIRFERSDAEQNILGYHVDLDGTTVYTKSEKAKQVETITLSEVKQAQTVKLTIDDANGGTINWVNVGVNEIEVYASDEEAVTLDSVIENLGGGTIAADVDKFAMPEAPDGFEIKLNGADFEQIIAADGTIVHPLTDKKVQVSFEVTETATGASKVTNDFEYTVAGTKTQAENMNVKPVIIPEIQEWYSESNEKVAVSTLTKITYNDDALAEIVDEFIADYEDFTGVKLAKIKGEAQTNAFNFTKAAPDTLLGEEGYTMNILADRVNVASGSVTGNMYGMQTILQMYKQDAEGFAIGQMRDYPRYEVRGLLLDIARKPIGMEMINEIAKTMRYYKMNDLQLHLSDNYIFLENYGKGENEELAYDAYEAYRLECDVTNDEGVSPTAKDYYITKAEMREFIQSQRALGMNIIPEIDMPAHATSFTKVWPELAVQGQVSPLNGNRPLVDHIDVSKEAGVQLIKDLFDDYTKGTNPTFDSETIVHIGADEFVYNYTAYRQFVNTIVPHVKETNTVRMWGGLTWIDDGKTEIVTEAIENVQMNLWSRDWADGLQMYNMGYELINTIDSYGYMVPNGGGGRGSYGDYLNVNDVFNNFAANIVSTKSGWKPIPSGDDQALGAAFAIWSDNIDKHASGLTESDLYDRFFDALPFYAEKTWAATGKEKGTAAALAALALEQGTGPNTNPYYQADAVGTTYESYEFADLTDSSENNRDLTAGTAKVEGGALVLEGGNSYVTTPIDKLGNGNELSFDITLTGIAKPGDILFETTPEYGTHDIRIMEDGTLGFTRELYNYYFDYVLPVGKTVNIKIVAEQQDTFLYVDGELIGEAVGKYIHNDTVKKTGIAHSTFAIPVERIGSETSAVKAKIDNVVVAQAAEEVDLYNKSAWTGETNSETIYNETEGKLIYAFDNNPATIWHSNWQGATDKLTGSNSFYAEIDFGQAYTINQFSFTPRTPQASGQITKADLYIKGPNDTDWKLVAQDKTFAADASEKIFAFDEQEVRYVKFVAKASSDGWVAVSEFDIVNKPVPTCTVYVEAEGNGTVAGGTDVVAGTEVTVTATTGEGATFLGWFNSLGEKVSENTEYTFTVENNTALVAKFSCEHKETKVVGKVDATCTEDGYTGNTVCKDCEEVLAEGTAIKATGHTFGDWTVVKAPTTEAAGLEERVCACGEKEQREVAKLPAEPEQPGTDDKEESDKEEDKSPATGDATTIMLWAVMMIMAAVVVLRKKER